MAKKMNNELHFAYQIKRHLNESVRAIPADKAARLRAAREQALARQKKPSPASAMAGAGAVSLSGSGGASLRGGAPGGFGGFEWLTHLVPVAVLAAGLIGISYWHQSNRAEENADIDTQILVDELPPSAYADKGFGAWIKRGQE